jgi:hypothetical protein
MKKNLTVLVSTLVLGGIMALTLPPVFAQTPPPTAPPPGVVKKGERHPRIRMAIRALEAAKREMQEADHDFGGHRVAALEECDKAINQLKEALAFDKQ